MSFQENWIEKHCTNIMEMLTEKDGGTMHIAEDPVNLSLAIQNAEKDGGFKVNHGSTDITIEVTSPNGSVCTITLGSIDVDFDNPIKKLHWEVELDRFAELRAMKKADRNVEARKQLAYSIVYGYFQSVCLHLSSKNKKRFLKWADKPTLKVRIYANETPIDVWNGAVCRGVYYGQDKWTKR